MTHQGEHLPLRECVDQLPLPVFVQDRELRIRWANPRAVSLLGVARAQIVGRACIEILRCTACTTRCAIRQARAHEHAQAGFGGQIRLPDGSYHSMIMDAVPLREGMVAILLTDVTQPDSLRKAVDLRSRCRELVQTWLKR